MDSGSIAERTKPEAAERAARIVAQHAETSRLLGVDFVAVYRAGREGGVGDAGGGEDGTGEGNPGRLSVGAGTRGASGAASGDAQAEPVGARRGAGVEEGAGDGGADAGGGEEEGRGGVGVVELGEVAPDGRVRAAVQAELDAIRARYEADAPHRQFVTAHTRIVFGEGDPCAGLMFIGEAPGADEDRTGRPFVGRAGQLLDKMIAAMGLRRGDVYIANVLKTRPPNNATPTMEEARLCAPYLFDQVGAVKPRVIVSLGLPATRTLLNTEESMSRLRGTLATFSWKGLSVPVMPTYHPAYVLRSYTKDVRQKVWSDLQKAMEVLRGNAVGGA